MWNKFSYEYVKSKVEELGYELISKEYLGDSKKVIIKDEKSYMYDVNFKNLIRGHVPTIVGVHNSFAMDNLKLWVRLNKPNYVLMSSGKYEGNNHKLKLEDQNGYRYLISFSDFKKSKKPPLASHKNPYTIFNYRNFLKNNNLNFELLTDKYIENKIELKCLETTCGEEFEIGWKHFEKWKKCPFCSGKRVGNSNCLAKNYPELVKQWDQDLNDISPYDVTKGSHTKVWWKCDNNHKWETSPHSRTNMESGCPYCHGRISSDSNNFSVSSPELIIEWNYNKNKKKPFEYTPYSNKKVWWECKNGHEWESAIYHRTNGRNCPFCSGFYPSEDYNLLTVNPELCNEWNYNKNETKPNDYTPNSNKKVWWKCEEGHEWESSVNNRNKGRGCPKCAVSKGEARIMKWLNDCKIKYVYEKKFDDLIGLGGSLLSYDFYLPNHNLLIEYQGEFHDGNGNHYMKDNLQKQQEHDRRKREYADQNGYELLEIWYYDFEKIEYLLKIELEV